MFIAADFDGKIHKRSLPYSKLLFSNYDYKINFMKLYKLTDHWQPKICQSTKPVLYLQINLTLKIITSYV